MRRRIGPWVALLVVLAPACTAKDSATQAAAPPARPAVPAAAPEGSPTTAADKPLPDPLPPVAARVNGQDVPTVRVKMYAESAVVKNHIATKDKPGLYRQIVQQFITRELLFQEALARKLEADTRQIESTENEARAKYKTEKDWVDYLGSQGMTPEYYKAELRSQFTVNALAEQVLKSIGPVTDADLQAYYDQHPEQFTRADRMQVSQILIRLTPETTPEAKKGLKLKAESIAAEARKPGADFAKLARQYSEEKVSAAKGGELEVFGKGEMPPELAPFEQAAAALGPGEVSGVVETPAGFHILKMTARLGDERVPLAGLKESLRHFLLQQRHQEAMDALVKDLRAKAKIEMFL
jgi:peptidyl-prolyl cis-trans isomerase C